MMPEPLAAVPDFLYGTAWKEDRTAALVETGVARRISRNRHGQSEAALRTRLAQEKAWRLPIAPEVLARRDIFLQTKFTYRPGQDHRLPYDPTARLAVQVAQSMASSLEHLETDHVDSYVLHGPTSGNDWSELDVEVWEAMRKERDAGRTRLLGVSNISLGQLQRMTAAHDEGPSFVQNRCFAHTGWDREVRKFCHERGIVYQGFSLLTANLEVVHHPMVTDLAQKHQATPAQVIFAFARAVGMLPLTGTSNAQHMQQDLASRELKLPADAVRAIEDIAC